MPSWYYEKKSLKFSPSIREGMDPDKESRYRREGARFIIDVGTKMGLRYDTMATGVVYFHRFYMFHSFRRFPRYVTACCCLFLAGKVEETPKKCKDIIKIAKTFISDSQFLQFGDDPGEEVMTLERILLQTIKFDLQVDHPYGYLIKYAKSLKGDKAKLQNMVQMAWTFINDSLCTTLCLQFEPEVIAIALMYLAGKLNKFEVVDWIGRNVRQNHWWDMFVEGMSVGLLEDICHQVLDLYSSSNPNADQDSPPATPPTKALRKMSNPAYLAEDLLRTKVMMQPCPIETTVSPAAPLLKTKEPAVGQPIPRLEPGMGEQLKELKRKAPPPSDNKKDKMPRSAEGKAIPTITSVSPPKLPTTAPLPDTKPPSPPSPAPADTLPHVPDVILHRSISSEPVFSSGIAGGSKSFLPPNESTPPKQPPIPTTPYPTALPPSTPPPFSQPNPPYYPPDTQSYNAPPPQMYTMPPYHQPPPPSNYGGAPPPPSGNYGAMPPTGGPPPYPPPPRHQPPPPPQYGGFPERPRQMRPRFLLGNGERGHRPDLGMQPYPPPPPRHQSPQYGGYSERPPRPMRPRFLLSNPPERGPRPPPPPMGMQPRPPRPSSGVAAVRITGSM